MSYCGPTFWVNSCATDDMTSLRGVWLPATGESIRGDEYLVSGVEADRHSLRAPARRGEFGIAVAEDLEVHRVAVSHTRIPADHDRIRQPPVQQQALPAQ